MRRRFVIGLAGGLVLLLAFDGSATSKAPNAADSASLAGAIQLKSPDPLFGGFSALQVGPDGAELVLLSDRGNYMRGRIQRGADGTLLSVEAGPMVPLPAVAGDNRDGTRDDSEGLAIGADGEVFIAYESVTRISRFSSLDVAPVDLPTNPAFARLPRNKSLEAIAIDSNGVLFVVPEILDGASTPVYVFRNGAWTTSLSMPRIGSFRAVSADFGPDGRFYLLERRFEGPAGFASRLRRFDVETGGLSGGVTLFKTRAGRHDNLEGLTVWRAPDGLRATMISDDNFFAFQVTEIVEYRLPD